VTGLIYVAIIAVWAVVLVPAWLRRHDHLDPQRSVSRFTRSMQALADRPTVLGIPMPSHERTPVEPEAAGVEIVRAGQADAASADGRRKGRRWRRRRSQAATEPASGKAGGPVRRRRSAAARRRIVLAVLSVALVTVGVLAGLRIVSPVFVAIPAAAIVGFLLLARHQVRNARRRRDRRAAVSSARTAVPASARGAEADVPGSLGETWEPRSTPLPTYVTAPAAAGFPRNIDTRTPGAWTAAAMLERAQKEKDRAERMAAAKAEAIARARAEQEAAAPASRDDEYLAAEGAWHDTIPLRRVRAVNE
jgi:hypothetical protein